MHDDLRARVRLAAGRKAAPTAAIIDSQSVKGSEMIARTRRLSSKQHTVNLVQGIHSGGGQVPEDGREEVVPVCEHVPQRRHDQVLAVTDLQQAPLECVGPVPVGRAQASAGMRPVRESVTAANAAACFGPSSTMTDCRSPRRSPPSPGPEVTARAQLRMPFADSRDDGMLACGQLLELCQAGRIKRGIGRPSRWKCWPRLPPRHPMTSCLPLRPSSPGEPRRAQTRYP